jgi:hypothetical protein
MPTAIVHVPKVRDERGVAGDVWDSAVALEEIVGRLPAGGAVDSETTVVILVVLVETDVEDAGWPA